MPKVTGKYQLLRRRLREYDIDQQYLAELLNRSTAYVSNCLLDKSHWQINEIWTIVRLCQIEPAEICKYFPPDGIDREFEIKPDPANKFAAELAGILQNYIKEAVKI